MNTTNGRIAWIDTARGLGLLAVFIGHLNVPYASAWVYTFHMPLFFFLSGLLYPGCEKYSFTQFAWRRFKGLVIPYFTLGAVIALFYCCVYAWHHEPLGVYLEMLRSFLVQEHYWTIWFLAALFLTQLIYYCIDWCFHQWKYAVSIVSVAVCLFGFVRYRIGWGSLPWNLDIALVSQLFFHLGYRFMHNERVFDILIKARSHVNGLGIIFLSLIINLVAAKACIVLTMQSLDMSIGMYGNEVLTFVAALAGILLIVTIGSMINSKYITYLGRNTMILFSWHSRIVIVACGFLYAHFGVFQNSDSLNMTFRAIVTLIIILLVLVPVNEVIKRMPCHKVFGV
ncbi:MAG: acyltransferase family protein [Muribaculaceae bacterium]|nr:acyltransferase family protein [Muribaculaceae bacterium]